MAKNSGLAAIILCLKKQRRGITPLSSFPGLTILFVSFNALQKTGKGSRYYPAEDVKPAKAVHRVKQNVRDVMLLYVVFGYLLILLTSISTLLLLYFSLHEFVLPLHREQS